MSALEWLTAGDVAAYLKISSRVVKDRARRGLLPAYSIPGGGRRTDWRFLRQELDGALLGCARIISTDVCTDGSHEDCAVGLISAEPIAPTPNIRRKRHTAGSVRYDKRRKVWSFLWYDGLTRRSKRIGTKQEYPTKAAAWAAVPSLNVEPPKPQKGDTVAMVVTRYQQERMPARLSTARVYRSFFDNHILPHWGDTLIADVQPRPFELWLRGLPLAPKTRTHLRSLMHAVVEFAMWAGILPAERNPISLVRNEGATKRVKQPRSLTVEEFQAFVAELREPFATLALVSVCLGLRVSEALALRWEDVDWLGSQVTIARAIVNQNVDTVKTARSEQTKDVSPEVIDRLKAWKRQTDFGDRADWIFASPMQIGRKPYSYHGVWREMMRAGKAAGVGHLGTHTMRHTFRSWLDAVGVKPSVQQKMMRHADIQTTMNVYGDVVTEEESIAARAVARLAFPSKAG